MTHVACDSWRFAHHQLGKGQRLPEQHDGGRDDSGRDKCSLREMRALRLLTIRELAKLAGVAPSTIFTIEPGRSTPHLAIIRRLVDALGVEPHAITEFSRAI
jgi:DNA-binding XRE family transcriptional regulator